MADLSPEQVYVRNKLLGLPELEAALKARDALRAQAEGRTSLREASDLFTAGMSHRAVPSQDAFRTQALAEADKPLQDAALRASARYGASLADPNHPVNKTAQALAAKHLGVPADNRLTIYDLEQLGAPAKMIADYAKTTGEAAASTATAGATTAKTAPEVDRLNAEVARLKGLLPPEIAAKEAEALKAKEEAKQIAPNAAAERAVKTATAGKLGAEAETEKAKPAQVAAETRLKGAEAGKIELETGGTVAPGWKVRGDIGVTQPIRDEFKSRVESTKKISDNVDQIIKLADNARIITDTKKRAEIQVRLAKLTKDLAHETGQRGLPQQDIAFFGNMATDPTSLSPKNILGFTEAATRLQTLKKAANEDLRRHADTFGIVPEGQGSGSATPEPAGGAAKPPPSPQSLLKWAEANQGDPLATELLLKLNEDLKPRGKKLAER